LDERACLGRDRVGVIEPGLTRLVLDVLLAARERARLEVAARADERPIELVEPAARRPGVVGLIRVPREMPFAGERRPVAVTLQDLGHGRATVVEVALVAVRTVVDSLREDA